jgi:large subunit ribosomal protein L3
MPEVRKPRRGSLAYWPRKRARRIYPHLTVYPKTEKAKILAFAGYKAGMTHAIVIDNRKDSITFGQEVAIPVTVLDCPPLKVVGIRAYTNTTKGLKVLSEAWAKDLPKDISRKVKIKKADANKISEIEKELDKISKLRLIVSTQPRLSGIRKKKPEIFEIEIGGKDVKEKFEFAKSLLGKEIAVKDVIGEGELVDVTAITKGKGTAGPVKRFGIKIQVRHAKKKLRHTGTLGPQTPRKVRWTVPMAGQLGFSRRTELNKRILKMGESGDEITPKSGFKGYGVIKRNYLLVEGSIPGSKKRLVLLRPAIRSSKVKFLAPEIKEVVV